MYINSTGYYVPAGRVDNDHFLNVNGLTADWILKRTGISTMSLIHNSDPPKLKRIWD